MTDNRRALQKGSKIRNGDKEIRILEETGRGANCIVYDALRTDGIGAEHFVRVKEYCPSYLLLGRTEEGSIIVPEKEAGKYGEAKEAFIQSYRKNVLLRQTLGIVNSTVDASDIFEENNTVYVVMPMDEGVDYSKYRDASLKELLQHMKSLSELVRKYHERGYLHLDVKPENVFILPETAEHILLFDYDSLTTLEEVKAAGGYQLSFSEGFSAPEQVQGKVNRIGKHTDIYSIGAMLFFKLFGRKPELEDSKISAEYDFKHMLYADRKYQPKLYRKLEAFFRKTLSTAIVTRWQEMRPVIAMLEELISVSDTEGICLLDSFQYNCACFVGRDTDLERMREILAAHQLVFLSGIGGIGKTELVKQYADRYRNRYDTIVFSVFEKDIQSLVCEEIGINQISREEEETDEAFFKRKLEVLKEIVTEKDLIVIDNFDVESDDKLELLFDCPCKFIVTTRMDFRDYNYEQITVDRLENQEDILELFDTYNDLPYSEEEWEAVKRLIDYVDGHTMTVELIAKYLRDSQESPVDLYGRFLEKGGTANTNEIRVRQRKDRRLRSETVNSHLRILFDVSGFDEIEKEILGSLSLLAGIRIRKHRFCQLCAVADVERRIEHLIKNGWMEYDTCSEKIALHQVIQDLVYGTLKPAAESCPSIVRGMREYITGDTANYTERKLRNRVFEVFMDRLSGRNLPYAGLCLEYGKSPWLEQAEKICLASGEPAAFDILWRICRKKIWIVGSCDDVFESELEFEEYRNRQLAGMGELFDKACFYCGKSSENPDFLVKNYIEIGYTMDSALNTAFFYSEQPVPAIDENYRKIIGLFDRVTELIPEMSCTAAEKVERYEEIQKFYSDHDYSGGLYRTEHFTDIGKAYSYQKLIDRLREEVPKEEADITTAGDWGVQAVWQRNVSYSDLAEKCREEERYEEAISYYKKACDSGEEIYDIAIKSIAELYLEMGEPDMAISYLEKGCENAPLGDHGFLSFDLIKLCIQQGDCEKAGTYARKLIREEETGIREAENANAVSGTLTAYFFLYTIEKMRNKEDRKEDGQKEKERLWQECLRYYEMLGEGGITEDNVDFIMEYLERETVPGEELQRIIDRIEGWQMIDLKKKIIRHSLEKYAGEKAFCRYHIFLLLKLAELSEEYPCEDIREALLYCDQAEEAYIQYGIREDYLVNLITHTRAELMSRDSGYEYDEVQEVRKKCDYRLLAEQKILLDNCGREEQIDIWKEAADRYRYVEKYDMEALCLKKALAIGIPMSKQKKAGILLSGNDYWNIMEQLINAYIELEDWKSADAAIREYYDKITGWLKELDTPSERLQKVRQAADYFARISDSADAVRGYLTAMYVGLDAELREDISTGRAEREDFMIHLCNVILELLEEEAASNMVDLLIDLKDKLAVCREAETGGGRVYDAIIAKIARRYQYQEVEFKRQ